MGNITSVTIARHPSGGDSPNRHPELVNCSVDIVPWRDMATVEMGASWDHEYQIKSSIQSSISRGSITWQISGVWVWNQVSDLQHLAYNKTFQQQEMDQPLLSLKKKYHYPWLSNLSSRISHQVTQISQPCCTDGLHLEKNSTKFKTAITFASPKKDLQ